MLKDYRILTLALSVDLLDFDLASADLDYIAHQKEYYERIGEENSP